MLDHANRPFLRTLGLWIFRGELIDPYHEFMIGEDRTISKEALSEDFNASYWDHRYRSLARHCPAYFQGLADRILVAGKYLNVVKDCVGDYDSFRAQQREEEERGQETKPWKSDKPRLMGKEEGAEPTEEQKEWINGDGAGPWEAEASLPQEEELSLDVDQPQATLRVIDRTYASASRCLLYILIQV